MSEIIFGHTTEQDPRALKLYTRQNKFINNEMRNEAIPEILKAYITAIKESNPNAILRSSTQIYNCVGMIFASRRTWVDTDQLYFILNEDNFKKLNNLKEMKVGDIVIYTDHKNSVVHVGILCEIRVSNINNVQYWVISKFGSSGEYFHLIDDVPTLCGKPTEFWTDRKG